MQLVDAAAVLRKQNLQFMLNIEIGNLTLGSAACCQTKDALDGAELGQVNSYVTGIKWVSPSGELLEASERTNPKLLPFDPRQLWPRRHRLRSDVQDKAARDHQLRLRRARRPGPHRRDHQEAIASNQSIVLWTVGDDVVIQSRNRAKRAEARVAGRAREFGWNFLGAFAGRGIRERSRRLALGKLEGTARVRPRAGVLSPAERRRRLHALRPGQDD